MYFAGCFQAKAAAAAVIAAAAAARKKERVHCYSLITILYLESAFQFWLANGPLSPDFELRVQQRSIRRDKREMNGKG